MKYIDIDLEEVPYRFEIDLAENGEIYTLEVHYNYDHDFFTFDLSKNGEIIAYGQKAVFGVPLFSGVSDTRLPAVNIVPRTLDGTDARCGWDELGTTVFLMVEPLEESE